MLGIDNIKKVLGFLTTAAAALIHLDQNKDGKVDLFEVAGLIPKIGFQIPELWKSLPTIKAEVRDLTAAEVDEIAAFLSTNPNLDLPADKDALEAWIRRTVNWLNYNYQYIVFTKNSLGMKAAA